MANIDIAQRRLRNQRVSGEPYGRPEDLVRWMGAVQSQEYLAAKWAMSLRLRDATDPDLDRAFDEGRFLRTHVMRPTWHFVLPEDIRWMLELTAPRIKAGLRARHLELELGPGVFARAIELSARFAADDRRDFMDQRVVPRRRQADRLRENRGFAGARYAVQGLVPPIVARDPEPRDARRRIHHLRRFFLERHPQHEIAHARFERDGWIHINGARLLGGSDARATDDGEASEDGKTHGGGRWGLPRTKRPRRSERRLSVANSSARRATN